MRATVLLILVVALVGVSTVSAGINVNCFNCTYWEGHKESNGDCEEKLGTKYSVNCRVPEEEGEKAYCRKIETKVDEKKVVHRDCHYSKTADLADQCPKSLEEFELSPNSNFPKIPKATAVCYCTRDKCNGATVFGVNFGLLLGLLALIKLAGFF